MRGSRAPIVETTEPTSKTIQRTANMINAGAELGDIRDNLLDSGLTEYQVFLAYKAAQILIAAQSSYSDQEVETAVKLAETIKR